MRRIRKFIRDNFSDKYPPSYTPNGRTIARLFYLLIRAIERDSLTLYKLEDLPDPADRRGQMVFVPDGYNGNPCLAASDGRKWRLVRLGAAL